MRKILFVTGLLLMAGLLQAQFNTVVIKPGTFTAEDEITISIDLTGTTLAGETELYIWTWCNKGATGDFPEKGGSVNTDWASSPAAGKMTNKGNNVWEFKLTGILMYGLEPGKLKHFQFLVKTKNGSKKSDDSPTYDFDPIVFIPTPYRVFPGKASASDVITVYFHQNLVTKVSEQRMTPTTVTVELFDENNTPIGQPKTWNITNEGNKVFSYSFIPNFTWTIPNNTTFKKFTYRFDGTGRDTNGNPVTVTGTTNEKTIDALK